MAYRKQISPIDAEVGARVRTFRLKAGLSQGAVGALLGVSFQQVQKYESGYNRIGPGRLAVLADKFQIPVAAFFGEDNRGAKIAVDTQLNTHTRRQLIVMLDRIESPRFESVLLALTMECAHGRK
jgi:transcriptional regulator with XRE-family HTH domain